MLRAAIEENSDAGIIVETHPDTVMGKGHHEKIVNAVEQLLDLYPRLPSAVLAEWRQVEDKIAHFEKRIDELVYKLYGLTDEEIALIKAGNT